MRIFSVLLLVLVGAVFTLWTIVVYLYSHGKNIIIALIPALFMTFITLDHLFSSGEMLGFKPGLSAILTGVSTLLLTAVVILHMRKGNL